MAKTRFQLLDEEKAAAKPSDKKRNLKGALKSADKKKKPQNVPGVKFPDQDLQGAGAVAEEELKASTEVSGASAGDGYKHPYNDEAEHDGVLDEIAHYRLDISHVTS